MAVSSFTAKKASGISSCCNTSGGYHFRIGTVVTDEDPLVLRVESLLQQSVTVTVETVLRNLQRHRGAVGGNAPASDVDEMGDGMESAHIVIDHHTAGIDTRGNAVIEHQGYSVVEQPLKVYIWRVSFACETMMPHTLFFIERLTNAHFLVIPSRSTTQRCCTRRPMPPLRCRSVCWRNVVVGKWGMMTPIGLLRA